MDVLPTQARCTHHVSASTEGPRHHPAPTSPSSKPQHAHTWPISDHPTAPAPHHASPHELQPTTPQPRSSAHRGEPSTTRAAHEPSARPRRRYAAATQAKRCGERRTDNTRAASAGRAAWGSCRSASCRADLCEARRATHMSSEARATPTPPAAQQQRHAALPRTRARAHHAQAKHD